MTVNKIEIRRTLEEAKSGPWSMVEVHHAALKRIESNALEWLNVLLDENQQMESEIERLRLFEMVLEAKVYELIMKHNTALRECLAKVMENVDSIMSYYGQGLQVHNRHLNGDAEPWDNFFDDNVDFAALDSAHTLLAELDRTEAAE